MIIHLVIGGLCLSSSFILSCRCDEVFKTNNGFTIFMITFIGSIFVGLAIWSHEPKAIDVYRGKTELKVTTTYENDSIIKRDSLVIFKK